MNSKKLHLVEKSEKIESSFRLLLDDSTALQIGDKPVFGAQVTINEAILQFIGCTVPAGMVIGWVDYLDESKFACITAQNHYVEASNFLHTHQNQLVISKPITIIDIHKDMQKSKEILTFSQAS